LNHLRQAMEKDLNQQEIAIQILLEALEHHDGKIPLSIHLIGNTKIHSNITIKALSKSLFGSSENDRVVFLRGSDERLLKMRIVDELQTWPLSLFVLENIYQIQNANFLAPALDDNFPHVEYHFGSTIKRSATNEAIFLIVSDTQHLEVSRMVRMGEYDALERLAKKHLNNSGWPDRICQRIRHVVPFI